MNAVPDAINRAAAEIAELVTKGRYDAAIANCWKTRLSSDDIRTVVKNYGKNLRMPASGEAWNVDAIEIKMAMSSMWSLRMPLFTEEEGRSDLTLILAASLVSGVPHLELDDLLVP